MPGNEKSRPRKHSRRADSPHAGDTSGSHNQPKKSDPSDTILARLVQKHFFSTLDREGRLLVKCGLTLLDSNGRTLDVDIWGRNERTKAHYLFRILRPNELYKVANCNQFRPTNSRFSNSQMKLFNVARLWFEPFEGKFNPRSYVPCTTSCLEAIGQIEENGTTNILATFIGRHPGPRKYLPGFDSAIAVGHQTEFEDRNGTRFYVLFWQPRNIRAPFELYNCEPGEILLLVNCRTFNRLHQNSRYVIDQQALHFTTLCHPVSNSLAVGPEQFRELRRPVPSRPSQGTSSSNPGGSVKQPNLQEHSHIYPSTSTSTHKRNQEPTTSKKDMPRGSGKTRK